MTCPASTFAHVGYRHEAVLFERDDDFLDVVGPFVAAGLAAGEATVVACAPERVDLLRRTVDCSGARFLDESYARPAEALRHFDQLFSSLVRSGTTAIRVVGEVPTDPGGWPAWGEYESAINVAFADHPLHGLCAYDVRTTAGDVLEDVLATHPFVAGPGRSSVNDGYVEPRRFLADRRPAPADPLERRPPDLRLTEPTPARARAEVRTTLADALDVEQLTGLEVGVSELVTNAFVHGVPPVEVRVWVGADRVVVLVADAGPGPLDPLAGLVPPSPGDLGGRGLWIARQLCEQVDVVTTPSGTGVRVTLSRP